METVVTAETTVAAAAAGVGQGELIEQTPRIPSFTIQADSAFGLRGMIALRNLAMEMLPRDEQRVIAVKLRDFDLYEEANRNRTKTAG